VRRRLLPRGLAELTEPIRRAHGPAHFPA
jgi:hypothetical protein